MASTTAVDYLREAFRFMAVGADCLYCAASLDIHKALCDNAVPVVAHVGLIPSQNTWTGGWKAVGKTGDSAKAVWDHVNRLEVIGCFGAELEVVPDRVAELISRSTRMIMLGMGRALARTRNICSPRTCSATRMATGHVTPGLIGIRRGICAPPAGTDRPYREFVADVNTGGYPAPQHVVPIDDAEFAQFVARIPTRGRS